MNARIIIAITIGILVLQSDFVGAQIYTLKSFKGDNVQVTLYYKPQSGILTISCLGDTLHIGSFMAIDMAKVVDEKFLKIEYAKRAGSNEDQRNLLILGVDNHKLQECLHLMSLSTFDMRNIYQIKHGTNEYHHFRLTTSLRRGAKRTYKISFKAHSVAYANSTAISKENFTINSTLVFDAASKTFISSFKKLTGYYTFDSDNIERPSVKNFINQFVPSVKVYNDEYVFINDTWFQKGAHNELSALSYK